jgi:subfamily B ATP-binding cassette protein MsbA
MADPPKKKFAGPQPGRKRTLIWARRWPALGLPDVDLRLPGLVLPWLTKYLVDQGPKQPEILPMLAWLAVGTTVVQAVTSYGLSQILGVAAQKAITDMRRRVEEHVMRLPVRYFDRTQSGILISRVMNDAEGIRNLVGTGLVQLVSIFTPC